jgi:hypothetical protein
MKMRLIALTCMAYLFSSVMPGQGATSGVGYDVVTKSGVGVDPLNYTPAVFETDAQAALDFIAKRNADAANTAQTTQSFANRFYITPSKQRTDYPMRNSATIVDCDAESVIMLDFGTKTYTVTSLSAIDAFPTANTAGPETPKTDSSVSSVTVDSRALGIKRIEGIDAAGYESTSRTSTPAPGGTFSTTVAMTMYYSNAPLPTLRCGGRAPYSDGYRSYSWRYEPKSNRLDPKVPDESNPHVKFTGLRNVPSRLALLTVTGVTVTLPNPAPNSPFGTESLSVVETGHIRGISSADPIFSIPPDFRPLRPSDRLVPTSSHKATVTAGIAYDQVTTNPVPAKPSMLTVATFSDDFRVAAKPDVEYDITRVYVTASKARQDSAAQGYAWIVDCEAGTLTTLSLSEKTYFTRPLEAALAEISDHAASDGTNVRRTAVTRALGTRRLGDISVPAYETITRVTIGENPALPGSIERLDESYFSNFAAPHLSCVDKASVYAPQPDPLSQFSKLEASGAELPDRIALFRSSRETREIAGGSGGPGQVATEIGHIRSISSDDAIFQVPPDFKPRPMPHA